MKNKTEQTKETLQARPFDIRYRDRRTCLKASLTVEAALVLPLLLFCMILLMMPLHMMNTDRILQSICEDVADDVSRRLYIINEINSGKGGGSEGTSGADSKSGAERLSSRDGGISEYLDIADGPALGAYAAARIEAETDDRRLRIVNVLNSDMDSHDDMVTVRIDYAYRLPFNVFGLGLLQQEVTASRRAWVGDAGSTRTDEDTSDGEDDEWVYIGRNPTRYHLTSSCHYLYNDWKTAVLGADGKADGRYPCERCGGTAVPGQTVYITPRGSKYHTDTGCTAMKSYPQMVRKSEVEHLGCCSYCVKHRKE